MADCGEGGGDGGEVEEYSGADCGVAVEEGDAEEELGVEASDGD